MHPPLVTMAASELEELRLIEQNDSSDSNSSESKKYSPSRHQRFPSACWKLVHELAGNDSCVDCGAANPEWAAISYGALLCIECSGRHRQLGVQVSTVRSISMDSWSHSAVLAMLEGGNQQLSTFFARHDLHSSLTTPINGTTTTTPLKDRYKTNAALFYRRNLTVHVETVKQSGVYSGRRRKTKKNSSTRTRRRGDRSTPERKKVQREMSATLEAKA